MTLTVAALITNYNTWSLAQCCIQELNRWSAGNLTQILVVDDASEENSPNNLPKNVKVIKNFCNRGYVASVNSGFGNLNEDIVLLLDSDAYPKGEIVQPLIQKFVSNSNLGALGFQTVGQQDQLTGSHQEEPTVLGLLLGQKLESKLHSLQIASKTESICIFSCAVAIRRTAFESIRGFDETFDFLDADIDFSMRLCQAGWDIASDTDLVVFHEGSGSYQTTAKRVLRHHKNRWYLLQKHGLIHQPLLLKIGLAMRHLAEYGILKSMGSQLIADPTILADKLYSREQLLRLVWSAYGNELN